MTRSLRSSPAVLAMALLAGCALDVTVPPKPGLESFISGRAVQAVPGTDQNQALSGASVQVLGTNLHVTTDALGTFTIGPLPAGRFQLYVAARGENDLLRQRLVGGVETVQGATRSVGDVSLQENAQLGGRALINAQTTGNAGVLVFVPGTDFITNTGDPGTWALRNLPAGTLRVSAFRTGFTPASTSDLELQGGVVTSAADLLLFPESISASPGRLSGAVVVMGAANHAGVTMRAVSVTTQAVVQQATSDGAGLFRLSALPPDLYSLEGALDGYPPVRLPNLAIGSGVELALAAPLVFSRLSDFNTPSDGGIGLATVVADAGVAVVDSGTPVVDAGAPDAGVVVVDSGVPGVDAGAPDAGVFDGGVIGECQTEAQCASGLLCVGNACVGCSASNACRAGSTCLGGLCRKDCAGNAGCPTGQVCTGGTCGACSSSAQCQDPALICDSSGACTRCQSRAQCPSGKACLPQGCGDCALDSECGAGSLCEQGVCLTGSCHTNLGCPSTQSCLAHTCTTCGQDTDCRLGQLCLAGACVQGNCRAPADCGSGQVCLNNLCGPCGRDTDCASGSLCVPTGAGQRCQPGVCHTLADCTGAANAGKICDSANQCVACSTKADCADATKVCDPASARCVTGNCGTAADCTSLGFAGQICVSNACTACTLDTQCGGGQLCLAGRCKTANCKDNSWCSGGLQLCELSATNPAAAQYTCRPCSPVATVNSADCGGAGRVCDAAGTCHVGTCYSQAQCAGGLTCLNNTCTSCTADAQCGAGSGLLCIANRCVTATCHGALPDPNVDCAATQVCVSNLCTGNCRVNADCAGTVPNPGTNYCDQAAHACSACTSSAMCGGSTSGRVCAGGACVPGQCTVLGATPNDTPCSPGTTCVASQCVQVGALPLSSTPYTEVIPFSTSAPLTVVSGQSQLYLSAHDTAGSFSLAFDGARSKLWRTANSAGSSRGFAAFNGGLVLPAPGYPQGELFVDAAGNGTIVAHRVDTGAPVWSLSGSINNTAVSMVGGVPQLVRAEAQFSTTWLTLMRADGTRQRTVTLPSCGGNAAATAAGTSFVFAVCYNTLYGIDPINDVIAWQVPFAGSNSTIYALVWRPPGLSGAAAGDLFVTASSGGASSLYGLFVPDPTGGPVTPTMKVTVPGISVGLPPFIDAAGAVYLYLGGGTPKLMKVSLLDGSTLANVTLPYAPSAMNLAGDGTLVETYAVGSVSNLAGVTITNGVPGTATLKWQVGTSSTGVAPGYPSFSPIPAVLPDGGLHDGGVIDMVTTNLAGAFTQVSALGAPGPSYVPQAPAFGVGGDPGNRMCGPAYECTADGDCAALQTCVLNRCIGTCRQASTCPAGQGCSLASCGVCTIDTVCRTGEVCNAGGCYACDRGTNPSCCSTNAECGAGACVQGLCRAVPNAMGPSSWLKALTAPVGTWAMQVQGTDGTLYAFDPISLATLHAFSPTGAALWTSPAIPIGLSPSALPMVVRSGAQDVLFISGTVAGTFLTAFVGPGGFGGWKTVSTAAVGAGTLSMAQGVSNATGTLKPAVFMSSGAKLFAIDPAAAASGTFTVLWQQPNTGCTDPSEGPNWVLIGSDGTVYHLCPDGSVQAWNPDGLTSQPVGLTRPGSLLWTSTPAVAFPQVPASRPAIGKVPSSATDVLYLGPSVAPSTSVLRVSAAGVASRVEVPVSGSLGFLVDGQGNGVALSTQPTNLNVLTPAGTLAGSSSGQYQLSGSTMLLTSDGLLWFVDTKTAPSMVAALQLSTPALPTLAFRFPAPGNTSWDTTSQLTFVPQALSGGAEPMLTLDTNLTALSYTSRMLVGMPVASGAATLTQWGTQGGDPQHRASLKTQ